VLVVAGTATVTVALTRAGQSTSAGPATPAPSTPTPVAVTTTTPPATPATEPAVTGTTPQAITLDERSTCNLLIQQLSSGVDVVNALNAQPDGSTVNRASLDDTVRHLHTIKDAAPSDMAVEIAEQLSTLEEIQTIFATGSNRTIQYDAYKTSGIGLAIRCRDYATG
jgi:hypothetical protein